MSGGQVPRRKMTITCANEDAGQSLRQAGFVALPEAIVQRNEVALKKRQAQVPGSYQ